MAPTTRGAEGESPAALRRRARELEARCHQLEDGIRGALLVHAQGNEPCFCPMCLQLRGLLLEESDADRRAS
jgi:hypothetical protein